MLNFILAAGLGLTFHYFVSSFRRHTRIDYRATSTALTPFLDRRSGLLLLSILPFLISLSCFISLDSSSFLSPSLSSTLASTLLGIVFGLALAGYLQQSSYLRVLHVVKRRDLTPRTQGESICCHADGRSIYAPNNKG